MTAKEIEALITIAGKATPGPYTVHRPKRTNSRWNRVLKIEGPENQEVCKLFADFTEPKNFENDADYLLAFSPDTATRLCRIALAALEMEGALEYYANDEVYAIVAKPWSKIARAALSKFRDAVKG